MISSITALSLAGLTLGVAVLVLVLSVLNGFERELRVRVLSVLPHAVLTAPAPYSNWQATASDVLAHPEVVGVAPVEELNALLVFDGNISGIQLSGVKPNLEQKVSEIPNFMTQGQFADLSKQRFTMVVGEQLSRQIGAGVGDKVTVVLPQVSMTLAGPQPRTRRFTIVGTFAVGSDADKNQVFIDLDDAIKLAGKEGVSSLRLAVEDLFQAPRVLTEVAQSLPGRNWYGSSWFRRHGNLYGAIQTQKTTLFLLLLMLVAVAAFNLVSNLVMIVNQRKGDIAIFRTMGATHGDILRIFIWHGFLVGMVGIVSGLLIGALLAAFVTPIYQFLDQYLGLGLMDEYFIHYLPSQILWSDLVMIGSVSALICLAASLYPAYQAARTSPVEALRYE